MAVDLGELLAPVSDDNPVGEDLSYDAERQEIEVAFESSVSGDDDQAEDVDWRTVIATIERQCGRTKDIWLAIALCRAGARSGRIEVVETGAQLLAGLVETYWDNVHPQLEDYGYQGRKGPCESLTRIGEFLGPLRRTKLLSHPRLGEYSGADFERFAANGSGEDGYGMFRAALEDAGSEGLRTILDRIDHIRDAIRRTDAIFVTMAEDDTGPNFETTYDALEAIRRGVAEFAGAGDAAAVEQQPGGQEGAGAAVAVQGGGAGFSGGINSREDVVRAVDAIIDYYRRREPGNPVPVLLTRAREWINADFLSILEDIYPAGMDDVRRVLVSQRTPSE
jgi:type VI secretion system protein ImpA